MNWLFFLSAFISILPAGDFGFSDVMNYMWDKLNYELCDENNISPNFVQLERDLKDKLFGQHLVINKLIPVLKNHFEGEPKKALVICMHGWTGSGKNYVTKIITDSIFKKKSESSFIKMYNGRLHFPIDSAEYVNQYKIDIQNWVRGNVSNCARTVFIFDEIDKMPSGIIDGIKPFFDYYEKVDSVDYRKAIFFFISNIGAEMINSRFLELWKKGEMRENMKHKDFEPYLREALYTSEGGLRSSSVIDGHLVSLYLPFLPLELEHVEQCVKAELERQKVYSVTDDLIKKIVKEFEFNMHGFSLSGCKRAADIVATFKYKKIYEDL